MTATPTQRPVAVAFPGDDAIQNLQRRNEDLAEAVAARDTFIAVAAHELRNPMTPILGQIDLLLATVRAGHCPPEQVEQRLARIRRAMLHYTKRAAVLLDVSRINNGNLQLEPEPFDLATLLREVADEFADAAQRTGVAITVDAPANLPVVLDRLAVEQVVDNLVSNALKYGNRTPVGISAAARGTQAWIEVRDGGTGIPPSDRARVLERFERAVGSNDRHSSGFGVGLWIVRQLVQAMGGAIIIGDAPGGGVLFKVLVPTHMQGRRR